ncbi:fibronectin type III domain-containing protein [Polymorphospora lycopeni]|uniref:Fibronectin type III domain-containing protein n=1 Tax=Polymorphospora lycopeni TaxID=3140240 RepID=A0ABV5CSX4_9ACTN
MRIARWPSTAPGGAVCRAAMVAATVLLTLGAGGTAYAASDTEAPTAPGPVTIAGITTTTIELTWVAATDNVGVTRYDVSHFSTDVVFMRNTTTNSITITGLRPSSTHRFAVRARDAAGNLSPSTPMLVVTMPPGDNQPPTAPGTPVPYTVADTLVILTWPRSTDNVYVALYEVLMVSAPGSPVVATAPQHPPTGTTARVTGLTPGTTYSFAVRARDDAGNISALSVPVTVTTIG